MAERRMFAKSIIDSDLFLDLPLTTQALYFHFGMRADDDGFLNNPKRLQRTVGCSDDDFKLLIAKRFIIPFESGIVVIRHWRIHNYIQKDRYSETQHKREKETLTLDENKAYTLPDTECDQSVYMMDTQVRLGKSKVSLGKDTPPISPMGNCDDVQNQSQQVESLTVETARGAGREKPVDHSTTLVMQRFSEFWNEYPKKVGKGAAEKAFKQIAPTVELFQAIQAAIKAQRNSEQWAKDNGRYIPNPATWLNQRRWEDDLPTAPNSTTQVRQYEEYRHENDFLNGIDGE